MSNTTILTLEKELKDWSKSLAFYEDELKVFEGRLEEVMNKNTAESVRAQTEHYQNQYILQKEQFDLLQHAIREQKTTVEKHVQAGDHSVKKEVAEEQHLLRNKVQAAEKIFVDTKHKFYRFLSEVL